MIKSFVLFLSLVGIASSQVPGKNVTLSGCYWPAFNGEYMSTAPASFEHPRGSSQSAYLWQDTDSYAMPYWVVGWGFEYNGNEHQMACAAKRLEDCSPGHWWYWYGSWYDDEDCEVVIDSASSASVPVIPSGVEQWYHGHHVVSWIAMLVTMVLLCGVYSWCLLKLCGARAKPYGIVKSIEDFDAENDTDVEAEPMKE